MVGRALVSACAVGAVLGDSGGRSAVHSALRASVGIFWAGLVGALRRWLRGFLYVLILYGVIIVIDGLVLQPVIMRRTARVPIWASLMVPILLSLIFGFWGLLLAAPLLAVIFAYRAYKKPRAVPNVPRQTPPGQIITGGHLISPGADRTYSRHDETL